MIFWPKNVSQKGIEYNFRPHNKTYTSPRISYHTELKIYVLILTLNEYIGAYTAEILKRNVSDPNHVFYKLEDTCGIQN